jgi:hypothetical protein
VETLRNSDSSLELTAEYLSVPPTWVQACVCYYVAHQDEVDDLAERERAAAAHEEELWRAQQAMLS